MTESNPYRYYPARGYISYTPPRANTPDFVPVDRLPDPPCTPRQRRPCSIHITRFAAGFVPADLRPQPVKVPKKQTGLRVELGKLASRDSVKRVWGNVLSPFYSNASKQPSSTSTSSRSSSSADFTRSNRHSWAASTSQTSSFSSNRNSLLETPSETPSPLLLSSTLSPTPTEPVSNTSNRNSLVSIPSPPLATLSEDPNDSSSGQQVANMSRPALTTLPNGRTSRPTSISSSGFMPMRSAPEGEKPICSGNGISCSVILAEPVIFLTGYDHDGTNRSSHANSSSILRGKLQLNVTKSVKIKAVTMTFTGKARTDWPEGIPPQKTLLFEEDSLRTQVIPFFNALYEGSEVGYGALCNYSLRNNKSATSSVTNLSLDNSPANHSSNFLPILASRNRSSSIVSSRDSKRLSLQSNQSRSFQKGDSLYGPTPQQKGYKIFHPGMYEYNFEIPIDNNCPETTKLPLASIVWQLEALVERAGTFKPNLQGVKEIPVIRSPSEDSLELVEPISISRKWEDQLHYEIMISGKSFPLGSKIPIAFKLTPLAKVQVHKIKVFVSENIEYFTNNKKVTRKDITRKLLLLEKQAGKPVAKEFSGSDVNVLAGGEASAEDRARLRAFAQSRRDREAQRRGVPSEPIPDATENLLGDLELGLEQTWGQTEIEMNVQLPTCEMIEKDRSKRLSHDCTWKNVNVHHWIKIVMRISRPDTDDPTGKKRRHFEISIDSPFTILNCRASHANLALPEYSGAGPDTFDQQRVCGCPNAAAANASPASSTGSVPTMENANTDFTSGNGVLPQVGTPGLARPPQAHLSGANVQGQRPIHMLRAPSFNPPSFDEIEAPPPLVTPPPQYDHVIGTPSVDGLADYFARLGEFEEDNSDEEVERVASRGRVNVPNPRTPGGRIARSFDIPRTNNFAFNPSTFNTTLSRETDNRIPST